jgi:hypothetical protein
MVISRKGRMSKYQKIMAALDKATNVDEAFLFIEKFNLTNEEANKLVGNWKIQQHILKVHRVI